MGNLLSRVRDRARQQLRSGLDARRHLRVRAEEVFCQRGGMHPRCDNLIGSEQRGPGQAADVLRRAEQHDERYEIRRPLLQHAQETERQRRANEQGGAEPKQPLAQIQLVWPGQIRRVAVEPRPQRNAERGDDDLLAQPLRVKSQHGCGDSEQHGAANDEKQRSKLFIVEAA